MTNLQLELSISEFPEVLEQWNSLARSVRPSYFQSPSWQLLWQRMGSKYGFAPKVFVAKTANEISLLSSFVLGKTSAFKIFSQSCAYLNTSGKPEYDVICSEGNQPLLSERSPQQSLKVFLEYLVETLKVKQIFINAIPENEIRNLQESCSSCGLSIIEEQRSSHYWIDFEIIRSQQKDHLAVINQRTRGIIRRSILTYENNYGKLKLRKAASITEAKQWFASMVKLNMIRFESKGSTSSFSLPFLNEFHLELIDLAFLSGEIVMIRIDCGNEVLGYIYGFLYHNVIYVYQNGFNFDLDSKASPGLVAHHLAAQDALRQGLIAYDFLAGDYQYKKTLSNQGDELLWLRIVKPSMIFKLDRTLKYLKERVKSATRLK